MKTEQIIEELKRRVENDEPVSPASWVNSGLMLNTLAFDYDKDIAELEATMADKEAELIEQGESAAKAKILKTRAIDYKKYLTLKAYLKRLDEHIKLAKKRAGINEL